MQGTILSVGGAQHLVLGDDGARYTFANHAWRGGGNPPVVGARVEFQVNGNVATDVSPAVAATPPPASGPVPSPVHGIDPSTITPSRAADPDHISATPRAAQTPSQIATSGTQVSSMREIPKSLLILALLPALLLVLSAMPFAPWVDVDPSLEERFRRSMGDENISYPDTLWDGLAKIRSEVEEYGGFWMVNYTWQVPFSAYVLAILGSLSVAVAVLKLRNDFATMRSDDHATFQRAAESLMIVGFVIGAYTIPLTLLGWYGLWSGVAVALVGLWNASFGWGSMLCAASALATAAFLVHLFIYIRQTRVRFFRHNGSVDAIRSSRQDYTGYVLVGHGPGDRIFVSPRPSDRFLRNMVGA